MRPQHLQPRGKRHAIVAQGVLARGGQEAGGQLPQGIVAGVQQTIKRTGTFVSVNIVACAASNTFDERWERACQGGLPGTYCFQNHSSSAAASVGEAACCACEPPEREGSRQGYSSSSEARVVVVLQSLAAAGACMRGDARGGACRHCEAT